MHNGKSSKEMRCHILVKLFFHLLLLIKNTTLLFLEKIYDPYTLTLWRPLLQLYVRDEVKGHSQFLTFSVRKPRTLPHAALQSLFLLCKVSDCQIYLHTFTLLFLQLLYLISFQQLTLFWHFLNQMSCKFKCAYMCEGGEHCEQFFFYNFDA